MKIGFLFNHVAAHQAPHAAPFAFELSRRHPGHDVVLACSSQAELDFIQRVAALYPGHRCHIERLALPPLYSLVDPLVAPFAFARKKVVLKANRDLFAGLDALVAPERNCLQLRTRLGLDRLILIHTRHGAGDREGGFDAKSGAFDLTLLPGPKYVDRLRELGYLQDGRYAQVGWPKFDVVRGLHAQRQRFFANDRPVVVYNPHFDQRVSSWRTLGVEVLEFFAEHPEYNLIFAPHLVLFKRFLRHRAYLPKRFTRVPNILIDTGSERSVDMSYMLGADMYLGDVSSQVYEFLLEPRPCIFLNPDRLDWADNPFYAHWHFGDVVTDTGPDFERALAAAFTRHGEYLPRQRAGFDYTFYTDGERSAAQVGADTIAEFLARRAQSGVSA